MGKSLHNRLVVALLIITSAATLAAAAGAIWIQYRYTHALYVSTMEAYIVERGQREALKYDRLIRAHNEAKEHFLQQYANLTPDRASKLFDLFFHDFGDGTFRTPDELYDGMAVENIGIIQGFAAFVPTRLKPITPDRKRILVASILSLSRVAPSYRDTLESLWFFSPEHDIIIFAPKRENKLLYYRKTAPPDLSFEDAPFAILARPINNPEGITRCSDLDTFQNSPKTTTLVSGCQTPIRHEGQHLGVWGTTLPMQASFTEAVLDVPVDGSNVYFLTHKGMPLAHTSFIEADSLELGNIEALQSSNLYNSLMKTITEFDAEHGVLSSGSSKNDALYAYYSLNTPQWFFVIELENSIIRAATLQSILPIFSSILAIVIVTIFIIANFISGYGIKPLKKLAKQYSSKQAHANLEDLDASSLKEILGREDEIGELARSLDEYRKRNLNNYEILEREVAQRTSELIRANEAKSRFLANMSHELRTPMNGILGIAGALRRKLDEPDHKEMVNLIEQSANVLEQQLSDVLDVSKVEAGKFELENIPFNLGSAVKPVIDLQTIVADEKGLLLSSQIDPSCDGVFMGDPIRVKQIIGNLLTNAIKFTEHGRIELSLSCEPTEGEIERFELQVTDTGRGIEPQAIETIFDQFNQADTSIHRQYGGTGLGLTIVKALTRLMGGQVSVSSTLNKGSTFSCSFELKRAVGEETKLAEEEAIVDLGVTSNKRVLLAEDHIVNRKVVELILEAYSVDIHVVENGRDAVDAFKKQSYNLILMDVQMPVLNGLEAIKKIREIEKEQSQIPIPILVLSANTSKDHIQASMDAGATGHVGKPVTPETLISNINKLI